MPERDAAERRAREPPPAFVNALLRNPIRARIMALLEQCPGMNKLQVAKALVVHVNAADFHLRRLADAHLVETRPGPVGRETLCFTAGNVGLWEDPATRVLFGRGPPRQVACYLAEHPGASVRDAADALGLSVHTIRRHIRILEERHLVERLRVERDVLYHAAPPLLDWLSRVGLDRAEIGSLWDEEGHP